MIQKEENTNNKTQIYIQLLDDEQGTLRPVEAIFLGFDEYLILPVDDFENLDEVWEFPPGSIVKIEERSNRNKKFLLAVAP